MASGNVFPSSSPRTADALFLAKRCLESLLSSGALHFGTGPAPRPLHTRICGDRAARLAPEVRPPLPVMDLLGRIRPAAHHEGRQPIATGRLAHGLIPQIEA